MFQSAPLWFVYILKCADHTLYTGVTTDLKRRLHEHNLLKSGAKYTRTRRPVTLVYCEIQPNRAEACKREFQLKQLSREQKKRLIDGGGCRDVGCSRKVSGRRAAVDSPWKLT